MEVCESQTLVKLKFKIWVCESQTQDKREKIKKVKNVK